MNNEQSPIPKHSEISEKYLRLWGQHDDQPSDPELWEQVIELVRSEEGSPVAQRGPYGEIAAEDLINLAKVIRAERDPLRRYDIVSRPGPTGEIWFDVLKGFSSDAIAERVSELLSQRQWRRGLDLGTGTGRLAKRVRPNCDQLIGLDRVKSMLDINDNVVPVQADVTKLPFSANNFDLIMSMGLVGALDTEQSKKYYKEIARVLEQDGVYIDAFYHTGNDELHSDIREVLVNAKGILADMIVDQVSGRADLVPANYDEVKSVWQDEGLQVDYYTDEKRSVGYRIFRKM